MIFGRKKKGKADDDDDDELEDDAEEEAVEEYADIDYVLFQGAMNGREANLAENARLAEAGLVPVKELITDALMRRAEILRIEPKGDVSLVTFSVDGVWYPGGRLSKPQALAITQMIKLLAGLDIRDRKRTQNGGINAELSEVKYKLYVESTPVAGGTERVIVNFVNPKLVLESSEQIGIPTSIRNRIREITATKKGITLICGPPKSGISTTLIGVVRSVDSFIYTIYNMSDLGDRELAHIVNFEKTEDDDLETTIGRCIRVEADVIIMDPLRDAETAATLFKMQEKVHFIAEFPVRDTASGLLQLLRWLQDPELVGRGLSGIFSQRMIRLLCENCKQAYRPNPKLLEKMGIPPETRALYRPPVAPPPDSEEEGPEPCDACGDIGYRGRTALFEFLEMTDGMREVISHEDVTVEAIRQQMKKDNSPSFHQEGLRLVAEGKTSLEELQRIFKPK